MKPGLPWSVKGIDHETRQLAKAEARKAGLTLGLWLTRKIHGGGEAGEKSAAGGSQPALTGARGSRDLKILSRVIRELSKSHRADGDKAAKAIDKLSRRLSRIEKKAGLGDAIPVMVPWRDWLPASREAWGVTGMAGAALLLVGVTVVMWDSFLAGPPQRVEPGPAPLTLNVAPAPEAVAAGTLPGGAVLTAALAGPVTDGVEDDLSWLEEAAEQGVAIAQYDMGLAYLQGNGVARDYDLARRWFDLAAAQEFADAQFHLGVLYENGLGTESSDQAAAFWYSRAAREDHIVAMHNLAVLYASGRGVEQDYSLATRWFTSAAERGFASSQYNLGWLNERGLVGEPDPAAAFRWYALAFAQGHTGAEARRDAVASGLDENQIARLREEIAGWQPRPDNPSTVRLEEGG